MCAGHETAWRRAVWAAAAKENDGPAVVGSARKRRWRAWRRRAWRRRKAWFDGSMIARKQKNISQWTLHRRCLRGATLCYKRHPSAATFDFLPISLIGYRDALPTCTLCTAAHLFFLRYAFLPALLMLTLGLHTLPSISLTGISRRASRASGGIMHIMVKEQICGTEHQRAGQRRLDAAAADSAKDGR